MGFLEKLIKRKKMTQYVFLKGKVEGEEKMGLIAQAKSLIMPSRYENFSIVALEAIALGKPLLCFDISGLKWIPEDTAVKATPFSTTILAKNIEKISIDKKFRELLRRKTLELSASYSWSIILQRYQEYMYYVMEENK